MVIRAISESTPAHWGQRGLGLCLLGLGVGLLWDYPLGRPWLAILALVLGAAQWRDPRAWLIALPVLLAVVDLGAWSGRLLLGEQDALLAILAGSAWAAGQASGSGAHLLRRSFVPVWFLALVLLVGLVRGLFPLAALDANAWNGYLSGWNALRVAKGPLWALVFWPLLAAQLSADRTATETRLAVGCALALSAFGGLVLWERGLLIDLVTATNLTGLAATWLDLSGTYRITGPVSQMHLGGEAVDGLLVLAWPLALWTLLRARRWPLVLLGAAALGLAAYALMVTFTRTTYLAVGVAFLTLVSALTSAVAAGHAGLSVGRLAATAGYLLVSLALFLLGYRWGGSLLLLGYLPVILGGLAAGLSVRRGASAALLGGGLAVLFAAGAALALRAMLTSRWNAVALAPALAIVLPSILVLGVGGLAVGRMLRPHLGWRAAGTLLLGLGLLLATVTLSLSGYQIQARAATAGQDLKTRLAHWQHGLSLRAAAPLTVLLGEGLGSFPLTNVTSAADHSAGIWFFPPAGRSPYLRLAGTGDLCFGQRLTGLIPGSYRVLVRARNPGRSAAGLKIKLQPRRLLEPERWQPSTRELGFPLPAGAADWQDLAGRFDLDAASLPPWYDPRTTVFVLTNQGAAGSVIDIARVRLLDPAGRDLLANGDFSAGGDRWFAFNDFRHLAWHLKNLYVALYFDLGLLGLAAFAALSVTALGRAFGQARRGHLFGAASAAALVGFLVLGLTGTLLDVPALMTLFLLLALCALWREPARRRVAIRSAASSAPRPDGDGPGLRESPAGSPGSPRGGCAVPGW